MSFLSESLPLIIILSAVIGGIVLTVAAILIMILCRRSSALSLKAMGNRGAEKGGTTTPGPSSVITSSSNSKTSSKLTNANNRMVNEASHQHYLIDQPDEGDGEGGWGGDPSESLLPGGQRSNNFEFPARMVSPINSNLTVAIFPLLFIFMAVFHGERVI